MDMEQQENQQFNTRKIMEKHMSLEAVANGYGIVLRQWNVTLLRIPINSNHRSNIQIRKVYLYHT